MNFCHFHPAFLMQYFKMVYGNTSRVCFSSPQMLPVINGASDAVLRALWSVLRFRPAVSGPSQPSHRDSPVQTLAPFGQTPLQRRVAECTEPHSELHTQHKLLYKHMVTRRKLRRHSHTRLPPTKNTLLLRGSKSSYVNGNASQKQ